jgi:hypothetical protein
VRRCHLLHRRITPLHVRHRVKGARSRGLLASRSNNQVWMRDVLSAVSPGCVHDAQQHSHAHLINTWFPAGAVDPVSHTKRLDLPYVYMYTDQSERPQLQPQNIVVAATPVSHTTLIGSQRIEAPLTHTHTSFYITVSVSIAWRMTETGSASECTVPQAAHVISHAIHKRTHTHDCVSTESCG